MSVRAFMALALLCLVSLSACSKKDAVAYPGVAKLAHALNANGIACEGFEMTSSGSAKPSATPLKEGAQPLIQQSGDCSHESSKLLLFTFASSKKRDHWVTLGQLYGSIVIGPDWAVATQKEEVAGQISDAIGGDLR